MHIQEQWEKALSKTEIVRPRVRELMTFSSTRLPYIFLAESSVNRGDAVDRKGEVIVERPSLVLPPNLPQFEGFDFEKDLKLEKEALTNFFLIRGIRFPSLRYNNKTSSLDIYEGGLNKAIEHYRNKLEKEENVDTGLIMGPEDCWQLSILIFICSQVAKSVGSDMKRLLDKFGHDSFMA